MPNKLVIYIFHADDSSLGNGAHVSERMRQVKDERGVGLEVYVFGPAEKALGDPAREEYPTRLTKLAEVGMPVHVCRSIAEDMGKADEFTRLGFTLEYARDAFVRFAPRLRLSQLLRPPSRGDDRRLRRKEPHA